MLLLCLPGASQVLPSCFGGASADRAPFLEVLKRKPANSGPGTPRAQVLRAVWFTEDPETGGLESVALSGNAYVAGRSCPRRGQPVGFDLDQIHAFDRFAVRFDGRAHQHGRTGRCSALPATNQ